MKDRIVKMFSRSTKPLTTEQRDALKEAELVRARTFAELEITRHAGNINLR